MVRHSNPSDTKGVVRQVTTLNWARIAEKLDEQGYARTGKILTLTECRALRSLYDHEEAFRSRVVMARHGFGRGEYRYLSYPLPSLVQALRETVYPRLVPIANRWRKALGESAVYPPALDGYLARCHRAGQSKPTPLLLKYTRGDYNCLHQDLYGELVFPLQLTLLLSKPEEFRGGEFLLVENRPRRQARGHAVVLRQGEAVVFPVHHRPIHGKRGYYRATVRHGVSALHSGERLTLGIIFHDGG